MKKSFNSSNDLYKHLKPALETKVAEIKRMGIKYITPSDIWNYLKLNKWSFKKDLSLEALVDDILNVKVEAIDIYLKKEMLKMDREAILENESLL